MLKSRAVEPESCDTLVVSAGAGAVLDDCVAAVRPGGLLFVYGEPAALPELGVRLRRSLVFKYWIALDIADAPAGEALPPAHRGLLLFWKPGPRASFSLNTRTVRVPFASCAACGKSLKDWGGKRHLMNPLGTALSDVWRDLPRRELHDHVIPDDVLARVRALTERPGAQLAQVVRDAVPTAPPPRGVADGTPGTISVNGIHQTDCVAFLDSCPAGCFDLCFADPPYNLAKLYSGYDDTRAEAEYLAWCDRWLAGMVRALKPGGSLFVLNLPKWGMDHAVFLNRHLQFRHWIAWDALSEPRGKIMPAHYALLWHTKPGAPPTINQIPSPDAPRYCVRPHCVQRRKTAGDDAKVALSDVWFDIHRIRHKRDRDAHPCQLPEKLLERILALTTRPGDVVFDPFGGTGTTAVVAQHLGRRFVLTETDPEYVRIAQDRLATRQRHADLFGHYTAPRARVARPRKADSKREVELYLQDLAQRLQRVPAENEIDPAMLAKIDRLYPYRGAALKRCRVVLTP